MPDSVLPRGQRASRATGALRRGAWRRLLELPTSEVARELVGWRLVRVLDGVRLVGRIVETEAYLARDDGASHSARGKTARNASMFLAAGRAYVYRIYGMHWCLNVVTGPAGIGEAVLVRALEPLAGLAAMQARRGARVKERELCRGPGRLCQAFGITGDEDGLALARGALRLLPPESGFTPPELVVGPRIGITKSAELALRFRPAGSRWTT